MRHTTGRRDQLAVRRAPPLARSRTLYRSAAPRRCDSHLCGPGSSAPAVATRTSAAPASRPHAASCRPAADRAPERGRPGASCASPASAPASRQPPRRLPLRPRGGAAAAGRGWRGPAARGWEREVGGGARCGQSVPGCAAGVCMGSRGGGAVRPVCHWLGCVCLYGVTWGGGGGGRCGQSASLCVCVRTCVLPYCSSCLWYIWNSNHILEAHACFLVSLCLLFASVGQASARPIAFLP